MTKFTKTNIGRIALILLVAVLVTACGAVLFSNNTFGNVAQAETGTIQDIIAAGADKMTLTETGGNWEQDMSASVTTYKSAPPTSKSTTYTSLMTFTFNEVTSQESYFSFNIYFSTVSAAQNVLKSSCELGFAFGSESTTVLLSKNGNSATTDSGASNATVKDISGEAGWKNVLLTVPAGTSYVYLKIKTETKSMMSFSAAGITEIRNVTYVLEKNPIITVKSSDKNCGTVEMPTADGVEFSAVEDGYTATVEVGTTITVTATPTDGCSFYGWLYESDFVSSAATYKYTVNASGTLVAQMATTGSYQARSEKGFFDTIENAIKNSQYQVTVLKGDFTVNNDIVIPENMTLVVPYNGEGAYYGQNQSDGLKNNFAWSNPDSYRYTHVTFNGKVDVKGKLNVGGLLYCKDTASMQGHTSNSYAEITVNNELTVNGGYMDVCGLVSGNGGITVNSGTLKQPYVVLDFTGGTNAAGFYTASLSPFNRYAMVNIQCDGGYTINYGGTLTARVQLYASSQYNESEAALISSQNAMFVLSEGASVKSVYKPQSNVVKSTAENNNTDHIGKTTVTFNGGATLSSMSMNVGVTVDTKGVYFPVPYNYEIHLKEGDYTIQYKVNILPGASLFVEQGANLTVNDNGGLVVFDGLDQVAMNGKSYPTPNQLSVAGYSTCGNLVVDGSLKIGAKTKLLGAVQTTSTTGKIQLSDSAVVSGTVEYGHAVRASDFKTYNCGYFKADQTAKVWDKSHNTVANLVAGKSYTALHGDAVWQLPANETAQKETQSSTSGSHSHALAAASVPVVDGMKGSWREDHEEHKTDWTPSEAEFSQLNDGKRHIAVSRTCSVLGCEEHEDKQLLFVVDSLGGVTYSGNEVTPEQLKTLFEGLFGSDVQSAITTSGVIAVGDGYTATVRLTDGFWYQGGQYVDSVELNFKVNAYTLTATDTNEDEINVTYNGEEQKPVKVFFNGQPLNDGDDYTITYQSNTNAGSATARIVGNGNFAGDFSVTFEIGKMKLVYKAKDLTSPYGEEQLPLTFEVVGSQPIAKDKAELESHLRLALATPFDEAHAGDEITITIDFDNYTPDNYDVEFRTGTYTVTNALFESVEFKNAEVEYDGQLHKLTATGIPDGAQITYTVNGEDQGEGKKNVGVYQVKLHIELTTEVAGQPHTYTHELTRTLTISARNITVTVEQRSFIYNGETVTASYSPDWYQQTGEKIGDEDLFITIDGQGRDAGSHNITCSVSGADKDNYNVVFNGATTFTITKAKVTVELKTVDTVYGNALPDVKQAIDLNTLTGVADVDKADFDISNYVILNPQGIALQGNTSVGVYAFEVSYGEHKNYTFEATGTAAYNVTARPVTVNVNDVSGGVYNEQHRYNFDGSAWSVDDGTPLAAGEEASVLNVTLVDPHATNAGRYPIVATYDNGNYVVTFAGSWQGEEHTGAAGTYTVAKKDISDEEFASFYLYVDGEEFDPSASVRLVGTALALTAKAYYFVGDAVEPLTLNASSDPSSISSLGETTVTVTIDDINYTGSKSYTVNVVDADGFTTNLGNVLKQLKELCGEMTVDSLSSTQETFNALKQAKELLNSLSEEEKEAGRLQLAPYTQLLDAWNNLAHVDESVITTAEAIASVPVKGLMIFATLNALLAAAFAVLKGGIR